MKKFLTLAAGAALALSMFVGGDKASASSDESVDSLKLDSFKEHVLESIRDEYPNAQFIDLTPKEYEQHQKLQDTLSITPFASVPPLRYLEVYAARSSNHPNYEYFSPNQLSSLQDHGGTVVQIVTEEIGYGYSRTAKLNGIKLKELASQFIDYDGDTIVDGWYTWWDANGYENGTFNYQNKSTNYPWNLMSDNMYIK